MAELAALALVAVIVWAGFYGLSWYAVFGLAVIGTLVYFWMRSSTAIGVVRYTTMIYATQVLTVAILFAIGRGLASVF
ncbi:MAG: hypothetical protein E5W82_28950 [Mesorhizobium sp.]|nr:MAG: hypothetical protein E5W82_28950 [Mesorhizobium sp.]